MYNEEKELEITLLREKILNLIALYAEYGIHHEESWNSDDKMQDYYKELCICEKSVLVGDYSKKTVNKLVADARVFLRLKEIF